MACPMQGHTHSLTYASKDNLVSLDCGRNQSTHKKTHTNTGEHANLETESPPAGTQTEDILKENVMLQEEMQNCSDYLNILQPLFADPARLSRYSRFKMQIKPQRNSDTYRHQGPRLIRPDSPSPRHTASLWRYTSPDPCKQTAWGCRFLELQKRRAKTNND